LSSLGRVLSGTRPRLLSRMCCVFKEARCHSTWSRLSGNVFSASESTRLLCATRLSIPVKSSTPTPTPEDYPRHNHNRIPIRPDESCARRRRLIMSAPNNGSAAGELVSEPASEPPISEHAPTHPFFMKTSEKSMLLCSHNSSSSTNHHSVT
jgi:hypothetical protein